MVGTVFIITLAEDHLLLNLSPSRFDVLGKEAFIKDKAREAVIDVCVFMTLPSILTGCGKSTLLMQIINYFSCTQRSLFFFTRLTAFVSLRNINSVTPKAGSESGRTANLQEAATNFFNSIGLRQCIHIQQNGRCY